MQFIKNKLHCQHKCSPLSTKGTAMGRHAVSGCALRTENAECPTLVTLLHNHFQELNLYYKECDRTPWELAMPLFENAS